MTAPIIDERLAAAIRGSTRPADLDDPEDLAALFVSAGRAARTAKTGHRTNLTFLGQVCSAWLTQVTGWNRQDVAQAVRAEYERAHAKHNGLTPYSDRITDQAREAILLEEVGEIARCCTPDAGTETGHAGDLVSELVQVITMAAAWAARLPTAGETGS